MGNMQSPKKRTEARGAKTAARRTPLRLGILMGIATVMLGALGVKAYQLQITDYTSFKNSIKDSSVSVATLNVRRGDITDETGKLLVTNSGQQAITYTKPKLTTEAEIYREANLVGRFVTVDTKKLSKANTAAYYVQDASRAAAVAKDAGITATVGTDKYADGVKAYALKHLNDYQLTAKQENKAMIYQLMANAYALSMVFLKSDGVTADEIASIGERQTELPGISVGIAYTRTYPQGDSIKTLVGTVGSIPENSLNQYLSKGYSRDDTVGTSFLEKQYEDQLKGTKEQVEVETSENGTTTQKVTSKGIQGSTLQLTINSKFQEDSRAILEKYIPGGQTTGAYMVAMNPKTGGVYAMVGVDRDPSTGKLTSNDAATMNSAQVVGSVVKPAMITNALMHNTITPENNTLTDQPIQIAGSAVKASYFNKNGQNNWALTVATALEFSSNSYVMQLMLKMGGLTYTPGMTLAGLDSNIFETMRNGFARFGLGVRTGIDLPGEVAGIKGASTGTNIGFALDESFGQYDTYTTMQLAQYVSAIANGGYRVQPHLVDKIVNQSASGNQTIETVQPKVLNAVGWTEAERKLIWQGMYQVVHDSSVYATGTALKDLKPEVYMKTGTAETFTNGQSTVSYSGISFVPEKNIAIAILIPGVSFSLATAPETDMLKEIWPAFWADVQDDNSTQN
jgi:cell division protein FtsI/penicillin-binding protein 2